MWYDRIRIPMLCRNKIKLRLSTMSILRNFHWPVTRKIDLPDMFIQKTTCYKKRKRCKHNFTRLHLDVPRSLAYDIKQLNTLASKLMTNHHRPHFQMHIMFNTWRSRQNGRQLPDDIFKCILLNENVWISIKISLNLVPNGSINTIPALVQIMAWRRQGDKLLSEPVMDSLLTHMCVTRPQWD